MRKTLLCILVSLPFFGISQSLSLSNQRIEVSGDLQLGKLSVTNNSGFDMQVMVRREIITKHPDHDATFCWGASCYPPNVNESTYPETIYAGQTNEVGFHGDLECYNAGGVSEIKYIFYDQRNADDKTEYVFRYECSGISIAKITQDFSSALSGAYPNPAKNYSRISYDLSGNQYTNANIFVRDLTGKVVKRVKLESDKGEVTIGTESMAPGIYTYSLMIEDRAVLTKKLIISN